MFRRRSSSPSVSTTPEAAPTPSSPLLDRLKEQGWVLPRSLHQGNPAAWSLVGTIASETATPVDQAGLVVGEGWSLDWWVGADDRWHLPSREAAVRQQLLDEAPVVETLVRIPGGDAVQRAYGIRSPREVGDEWVIAEVANQTAVPFAVALVLRPFVADGIGSIDSITLEPVDGGAGRDQAYLVRVDGRPAVVVPRKPARVAVGNAATGDVDTIVTSGAAGTELVSVDCPDSLATLAMIFPLTHTSVLRAAVPVGPVGDHVEYPVVMPEAASVASGWEVHRRGPRVEIPERRLVAGIERARAHLQLAHDGTVVRRDGHRAAAVEPGATEVILGAYDLLGRPADVGAVVARWIDMLADASPAVDAMFLTTVSRHWQLHRVDELLDWMLPEVAAAVERLDRAQRRGRLDPITRQRAGVALTQAAELLAATGQPAASTQVAKLAERVTADASPDADPSVPDRLLAAAALAAAGDPAGVVAIRAVLDDASPTTTWPGPGPDGRPIGHDLAASAALVHAGLATLVGGRPNGLALLPHLPDDWYGAPIELHDAPTPLGTISYAIRWHGLRPALLWDFSPHEGVERVTLTAPGLDRQWETTEIRGDALLAEVRPPGGLERLKVIAEHPDIDPAMRKPAPDPEPPTGPLPDGGGFS